MTSQEKLRNEIATEREQLVNAVDELRGDVSKITSKLPVVGATIAGLGALRLALKLRRR
jgi:hypothetical protein